jgi:hypothetical protein
MPLGGQECTLPQAHAPPPMHACPSYVCAPWALLSPLRLIYVPWGLIYAPLDSFMPLGGQVRTPGQAHVPPSMRAHPPLCVRALGSFKPL